MKHEESDLQKACVRWFAMQYPEQRGLLCSNLSNTSGHNPVHGRINKAMGLMPGRSDLVYYRNGRAYMIEVKTAKGRQSDSQKAWQKKIEKEGFSYVIVRSIEEFINLINHINKTL